ncbi:MAG: glucokinase [Cyanobacteria bacterium P01_G01_bin.39]
MIGLEQLKLENNPHQLPDIAPKNRQDDAVSQSSLLLAGDIGGTKTILRLVEVFDHTNFRTIHQAKYPSGSYPDLVPIVKQFLATIPGYVPEVACFAIAGAVVNNTSQLTNLNWSLDSQRLELELGLKKVRLINDFAANCYGVLGLKPDELYTLQEGNPSQTAPIAVIGAGTGLGAGFLVPQGDEYQIFASEGGHADFSPRSTLELELMAYYYDKYQTDHVSAERLVSGRGIVDIYHFLRQQKMYSESSQVAEALERTENPRVDSAAIISQAALSKRDRLCEKTMEIFVEMYGIQAGNLALTLLPFSGLYVTGGIATKVLPLLQDGRFIDAFKSKGRMSPLLEQVPVHVILNPQVGLLGSIMYGYANL